MELTRLQQLILYILEYAKKKGIDSITKYQIMKLAYMVEVESRKYTGNSFSEELIFFRKPRGPVSQAISIAINQLDNTFIEIKKIPIPKYKKGAERHEHRLRDAVNPKYDFSKEEKYFINSILGDLVDMPMVDLGKVVYATEPMKRVLEMEEKNHNMLGAKLDLNEVRLDNEILDLIGDEEAHE